jgi:transcriptional regulator with XRE-family HTH domain
MPSNRYDKKKVADVNRLIASNVRAQREKRGMLQSELAKRVGVKGPQMHKYETGEQRISSGMLVAIASAMNVRPSIFLPEH